MIKSVSFFEIFLIIGSVFAFSYFVGESGSGFGNYEIAEESKSMKIMRTILLDMLDGGLVSAQENQGLHTCKRENDCQEYLWDECNSICDEACFPGLREDYTECKLGFCFDPDLGSCVGQTVKFACERDGGIWSEQEPAQCNRDCCLFNGESAYTTETACNNIGQTLGVEVLFEEADNELECLVLAQPDSQGACVLGDVIEQSCVFASSDDCLSRGGEFYEGYLCTHEDLGGLCEKTLETRCFENLDGVYFVDSCGNRANIYHETKRNDQSYWNEIVLLSESCEVEIGSDPFGRQSTCGNCNRFENGVCGLPGDEDNNPVNGDFVCKSLTCVDEFGDARENGESWCGYESQVGVDGEGNEQRSVDLPGTRHYKRSCIDGEVRDEPCKDFRNGICVSQEDEDSGETSAACVINEWQLCIEANTDEEKLDKCEENEFCVLKEVNIDSNFKFKQCVPKHPPGFDTTTDEGISGAQSVCSLGSVTCPVIYVKEIDGWKCEVNCNCRSPQFVETMNNLCMSLGDCGALQNYYNDFSDEGISYSGQARSDPRDEYWEGLEEYSEVDEYQLVEISSADRFLAAFGVSDPSVGTDTAFISAISEIAGGLGTILKLGSGTIVGATLLKTIGLGELTLSLKTLTVKPGLSSAGGGLAGAVVGAAAIAYALEATGVGRGIPEWASYTLIAAGAYGGAVLGVSAVSGSTIGEVAIVCPWCGVVLLIVAVVFIVYAAIAGIGDDKQRDAVFECMPWNPPVGGENCEECGKDGTECSKYKCQSLGANCRFLNEWTSEEICVDINPGDLISPEIKPWEEILSPGFKYEDVRDNGFKIERESEECIPSFTPVTFGVELDEPGTCKWSFEDYDNYEDMPNNFLGSNSLDRVQHPHLIYIPSLDSLGISSADPEVSERYSLDIRCEDSSGNANIAPYTMNVCVSQEIDQTAPVMSRFSPTHEENLAYVSAEGIEKDIEFYVERPAECKWSLDDKDYDLMENQVDCVTDVGSGELHGWKCETTLPISIGDSEKTYYFRCLDQPWLDDSDYEGETEGRSRNANVESQPVGGYTLKRSSPLSISSISPDNEVIIGGKQPVVVDLEIETSGGVNDEALCRFTLNNIFSDSLSIVYSETHIQNNLQLYNAMHEVDYYCEDLAGNIAEASSSFEVFVDDEGPEITRVYDLDGKLNVITNEDSICSVSMESCGFNFEDGQEMIGSSKKHTLQFDDRITNYVKCQDEFGNVGGCLTVSGGFN